MSAPRPADRATITALRIVAERTGSSCAYAKGGKFYFPVDEDWALALSPDSAGRFRLGACYRGTEVATLWALQGDRRRLADLASTFLVETTALAARKG